MLKLKLQYFGQLMWRADSLEKTLLLGRIGAGGEGDDRGWHGWMASPTRWTWVWVNSWCWWWTGRPGMLQFMGSQRVRHDWAIELNQTERCTCKRKSKRNQTRWTDNKSNLYLLSAYPMSRLCISLFKIQDLKHQNCLHRWQDLDLE